MCALAGRSARHMPYSLPPRRLSDGRRVVAQGHQPGSEAYWRTRPASAQERVDESPFSVRCRDVGADNGAVDAVVAAVHHDLGERHRHGFPDPGFAPSSEPPIDRVPTAIFGRHVAPRCSATKPPENTVDDRSVLLGRRASTTVFRLYGQQALQNAPFRFSEIAPAQACLQKAALNQSSSARSIMSASPPLLQLLEIPRLSDKVRDLRS